MQVELDTFLNHNPEEELPHLEDKACYVLIACDHPKEGGDMQVKMFYKGDKCLASYLIDNAKALIDSHDLDIDES